MSSNNFNQMIKKKSQNNKFISIEKIQKPDLMFSY